MPAAVSETTDAIEQILRQYPPDPSMLIAVLQDVQQELRYLPKDGLRRVAEYLRVPLSQVYRVATFYTAFSLVPRGKHVIKVCMGTACHLKGAPMVVEAAQRVLGIAPGQTTDDLLFSLETVHCLGACALAPVVVIDNDYHAQMDTAKITKLIDRYAKE